MLQDILAGRTAASIDDVIAMMTAIDQRLPDADGVKWFNRLYLRVTERVRAAVATAHFSDPRFMTALDVVFANLYFSALGEADIDASRAPSAWQPLFAARARPHIARLQFALAGMNAHINRDLPLGIVRVFEDLGGDPVTGEAEHRDFDSVNDILASVEVAIKAEFAVGLIGAIDAATGRIDDVVAMWNVRAARAAAWTNAQVLWTLRVVPSLQASFFQRLDSFTGLAGRGLLMPAAEGQIGV